MPDQRVKVMENTKVSVTLTGPAKIDGKREPQGKTVSVSEAVRRQLEASGVVAAHQNPADQMRSALAKKKVSDPASDTKA
jgi:uncharacterized protein YbaA (DUF1428 family)